MKRTMVYTAFMAIADWKDIRMGFGSPLCGKDGFANRYMEIKRAEDNIIDAYPELPCGQGYIAEPWKLIRFWRGWFS